MRKFLNPQLKRVGRSNSPSKKTEPLEHNAAASWWDRKKFYISTLPRNHPRLQREPENTPQMPQPPPDIASYLLGPWALAQLFSLGGQYLEQKEMDRMTSTVRVFARAKPEDKLEIWVDGLDLIWFDLRDLDWLDDETFFHSLIFENVFLFPMTVETQISKLIWRAGLWFFCITTTVEI